MTIKLQPPQPHIDEQDSFANTDLFGYRDFGDRLTNIIESLDTSATIVLDGPWGSGKSTFIRQWTGHALHRGNATITFDAFANDHHDDAFFALAAEIYALAKRRKAIPRNLLTQAANVGRTLWPVTARLALHSLSQGMLTPDDVVKTRNAVRQQTDASLKVIKDRITAVQKERQYLDAFRELLSRLAIDLTRRLLDDSTTGNDMSTTSQRKLIFIVDELDRCRPHFALNLLERIKHIFAVNNVCFVLVADLTQLAATIEQSYGVTDGRVYLEKFYQLKVSLPDTLARRNSDKRLAYIQHLVKAMRVPSDEPRILELLASTLGTLANAYDLSLRTLEQVMLNVSLVFRATTQGQLRAAPVIAGLCVMKIVNNGLYLKARTGTLDTDSALAFMRFEDVGTWASRNTSRDWNQRWWIFATAEDDSEYLKEEWFGHLGRDLFKYDLRDRRDIVVFSCRCIDELAEHN